MPSKKEPKEKIVQITLVHSPIGYSKEHKAAVTSAWIQAFTPDRGTCGLPHLTGHALQGCPFSRGGGKINETT